MKKRISIITVILGVIILIIISCIVIYFINKSKTTTDNNVNIYGKNTLIVYINKGYVYDSKLSDTELKVPSINLNTEYATELNTEIESIYNTTKEGDTRQNGDPWYNTMSYTTNIDGDILSILIKIQHLGNETPTADYKVYNINIKSGNAVSNAELIKYINSNENKVKSKFIEQIKTKVNEKYTASDKDIYINKSTDSFSQEFSSMQMFLSNGKLNGICTIYLPVGREEFSEMIEIN